jgi:hypothetical protein
VKALLLFLVLAVPTNSLSADIERFCIKLGNNKEAVCIVSLPVLLARGEDFNGRLVSVTGYFAHSDVSVLFSSTESFMTSNAADGLAVRIPNDTKLASRLYGLDHTMVSINARFTMKPLGVSGYPAFQTGGQLYDVSEVRPAFVPWGYLEPPPGERRGE